MKIENRIVGQMELYMAFYEEDNPEDKLYTATKSDFHKPLTESTLLMILESYGNVVCKFAHFDHEQLVCEYISKAEYERNTYKDDDFNTFSLKISDEE